VPPISFFWSAGGTAILAEHLLHGVVDVLIERLTCGTCLSAQRISYAQAALAAYGNDHMAAAAPAAQTPDATAARTSRAQRRARARGATPQHGSHPCAMRRR